MCQGFTCQGLEIRFHRDVMAALSMRGSSTTQAAFAILRGFVARWYAYVLQRHTRLEVELDHGRDGARSGAGYLPSESSGAKVDVLPTVTAVFYRFTRFSD